MKYVKPEFSWIGPYIASLSVVYMNYVSENEFRDIPLL